MSSIIIALAFLTALLALLRAVSDNYAQRKQLRALHQMVDEASRVLKARANLANEVAHEIKNPITAILCSAEALELLIGDKIEDDNRKTLQYIREYGDILLRLISDFLDLSRAEVGKVEASPQPVEVVPCAQSIIGLLQSRAMRKQLTVELRCEDVDLYCLADPRHLKQVLFNLLYNAIKFTPEGGEVEVIISRDPIAPRVLIEVSDTGPGIPYEVQDHLFDLYQRYDHKTQSPDQFDLGTGLGLAVCKNLIELSGGMIAVESQLGIGSCFYFALPICESAAKPARSGNSETVEQPLLGLKFLIVDEDLGSRESVSRLIEAWGGMVDRVTMATEAIDALKEKAYDAVMIDDAVASVDGYFLPRAIKEDSQGGPTVIISGTSSRAEKDAMKNGADAYVEKPFNGTILLESLINDPDSRH